MWRRWWFWDFFVKELVIYQRIEARVGLVDFHGNFHGDSMWRISNWIWYLSVERNGLPLFFTCRSTMEVWGTIFYFKTNISYFCWWYNYELVGWHLAG
jgi:hypothetical protein